MGRNFKIGFSNGAKRIVYTILNSLISFLLFFIVYRIILNSLNTFWIVWVCLSSAGIISSLIVRALLRYWSNTPTNLQKIVQNLTIPLIYAFIIYIGVISAVFDLYISNAVSWQQFAGIIIFIKLFVFYFSDWLADLITFQG